MKNDLIMNNIIMKDSRVNNVIIHSSKINRSSIGNPLSRAPLLRAPLIRGLVIGLLASTAAHSAIVRPLDEMKVLEVSIAQDALTRIKIQDDRILHVFGNAGDYALETDDEQGQIFIRPTPQASFEGVESKSINLTLTTEAGYTQDLRLTPKNQTPETLILQLNRDLDQEVEKRFSSAPLFREEIEELILACRENRIPLGYKEVPLSLETLQGPSLLTREIQSQKLRGLTYRVHNNTKESIVLSEPKLAKELTLNAVVALSIVNKTLTPGEETNVYVIARAP